MYAPGEHRRRRRREHRARTARRARPARPRRAERQRARRAATCASRSARSPPPRLRFQRKDTEQYHVCLGAPGISRSDRRRFAASLLDAILGGSASSRLFQEIREKRGMAYSVYSFVSQYTDTGQIGIYVGTREDNLGDALAIAARADRRHRRRQPRRERARAREGEPQGADPALDGVDLDPHEPARQVADHRHGAALARAHHRRDRRGRGGRRSASSPAALLAPGQLSVGLASARARSGSSRRVERVSPDLAHAA